jgi:enamine deaminase RidA (YjgF/YER057c/UK114 family)
MEACNHTAVVHAPASVLMLCKHLLNLCFLCTTDISFVSFFCNRALQLCHFIVLLQPTVINGASNLLGKVFADKGLHARSALGTNSLPLNVCVEIEAVVEVEESSSTAKRPLDTAAADSSSAKK